MTFGCASAYALDPASVYMSPVESGTSITGTGQLSWGQQPFQAQVSVQPALNEVMSFPQQRIKQLKSDEQDLKSDLKKQQAKIKNMKPGDTADGMPYEAYQSLITSDQDLIDQKERAIKAYQVQDKAAKSDPSGRLYELDPEVFGAASDGQYRFDGSK
jgi:hypothetical protein